MYRGPLAGTTLKLRPWQKRFIRAVYRTDKPAIARFERLCCRVGRKNGKTQLAAALCLCALSGPEAEPRGECYSVACTRDQAKRVFDEMVAIITRIPWLNKRINIVRFRRELEDMDNGSTFRCCRQTSHRCSDLARRSSATTNSARRRTARCTMRWAQRSAAGRNR